MSRGAAVGDQPVDASAPDLRPGGGGSDLSDEDQKDLELVEAIRGGDHDAWGTLLARHQERLFNICLRMVRDRESAADCTQDAMVRIIQGLDSYDGRARLSTWMIRVTMNVVLSRMRREKVRRHPSIEALGEGEGRSREGVSTRRREGAGEPAPEEGVESHEGRSVVFDALQRLSPEQRAILILRDARGLEYEQIAEVLDVALGTVKSRLFRARAALREALEAEGLRGPEGGSDSWESR